MNYQHASKFLKTKYIEYLFPGLSLVDFFSLIVFVSVIVLHVVDWLFDELLKLMGCSLFGACGLIGLWVHFWVGCLFH